MGHPPDQPVEETDDIAEEAGVFAVAVRAERLPAAVADAVAVDVVPERRGGLRFFFPASA